MVLHFDEYSAIPVAMNSHQWISAVNFYDSFLFLNIGV